MAQTVTYEIQLLPAVSGERWRYVVTIAAGPSPNSTWTSAPTALESTNEAEARAEAKLAVSKLVKVLRGED
jgi:hypothetical protein